MCADYTLELEEVWLLATWNTELDYSGVPVPKFGFFLSPFLKRGF